jgi:RNA 2',3'-cyclic 3'-phosphodiesterase
MGHVIREAAMPRLFAGLEIPAEVGRRLARLRGGLIGARWIEPSDYHITLRFIGDIDDRTADEIDGMMANVRPRDLRLRLAALDVMGGDKPHSLVARVEMTRELSELQAEVDRAIRKAGVNLDKRRFEPHVTIARVKGMSPYALAGFLSSIGYFEPVAFTADRFVMYSSKGSVGGGPYLIEATYALDRAA